MKINHSLFDLSFRLDHCLAFAGAALVLCAFASTTLTAATSAATAPANTNLVPAAPASAGGMISAKSRVPKGPPSLQSSGWQKLFDGKSLAGWKITDFAGKGDVRVEDGQIVLEMGVMTGVNYTNPIPRMDYELSLEARRVEGSDFFCGLTFPVGEDHCSLIVGGWGGGVVGLSSLDGMDAASNETTKYLNFEKGRWYSIRLRITPTKIQTWIDDDKMVEVETTGRKVGIRIEVEQSVPLGIATWSTTGAVRNLQIREL